MSAAYAPEEKGLPFSQRLRIIADWLDILDARLEHQYGGDDVQRDFRAVAEGLEEDPTLDDLMTDLLRNTSPPTYVEHVKNHLLKGSDKAWHGTAHTVVTTVITPTGQTVTKELDPVAVMVGDTIRVEYTLTITA
jgi:hypothetical protein